MLRLALQSALSTMAAKGDSMAHQNGGVAADGLHPLLIECASQKEEFKRRRDIFDHRSCHPSEQQHWIGESSQTHREGKSKVQLKRLKPHDTMLEDQAWCLFYRMGYPELNA